MTFTSTEVLQVLETLSSQPSSIKNDRIAVKSHNLKDLLALYELLKTLEANEAAQPTVMPGGIITNVLVPSGTV